MLDWKVSVLYLDPCEKQVNRIHVVILGLPECQKFKIWIDVRIFQQIPKQAVHFDGPKYIEYDGNNGKL